HQLKLVANTGRLKPAGTQITWKNVACWLPRLIPRGRVCVVSRLRWWYWARHLDLIATDERGIIMNHDVEHSGPGSVIQHELAHLRAEWWWFLILGILLVLSGTVALVYPFVASLAAVIVLGMSLLISGI